ncbi:Two-component sensor histidine kinase [gamma proteobacterium HdN1]|nr:Two-component sensor histidine kinase [gamma proteobacterium HdN1]
MPAPQLPPHKMRQSLTTRLQHAFFAFSICVVIIMAILMILVDHSLEFTMLDSDLDDEINSLLTKHDQQTPLEWHGANLNIYYLPRNSTTTPTPMPQIFEGLPTPFSGEIERGSDTYLIRIAQYPEADIFIARDISAYETRATEFMLTLTGISLLLLIATWYFSRTNSLRISGPLSDLATRIREITPAEKIARLPENYREKELHEIATTFNSFLSEMEAFVQREQSLTNLASHELRTPIAVISGGIEILQTRGNLDPADQKTATRIYNACIEMRENIDMLLKLSRHNAAAAHADTINLSELAAEIRNDLAHRFTLDHRLKIQVTSTTITTDRILLKMLLINLIQNALQHTQSSIEVFIGNTEINVHDKGKGLPSPLQRGPSATGGLGLYIVTLICEAKNWELRITPRESGGTTINVLF